MIFSQYINLVDIGISFDEKEENGRIVLRNMKLIDTSKDEHIGKSYSNIFMVSDRIALCENEDALSDSFLGLITYIFTGKVVHQGSLEKFIESTFYLMSEEWAYLIFGKIKEIEGLRVVKD